MAHGWVKKSNATIANPMCLFIRLRSGKFGATSIRPLEKEITLLHQPPIFRPLQQSKRLCGIPVTYPRPWLRGEPQFKTRSHGVIRLAVARDEFRLKPSFSQCRFAPYHRINDRFTRNQSLVAKSGSGVSRNPQTGGSDTKGDSC
jgi:hypothetical protein